MRGYVLTTIACLSLLFIAPVEAVDPPPYVATQEQSGHLLCQAGTPVLLFNCLPVSTILRDLRQDALDPNHNTHLWSTPSEGLGGIVVTLSWEPSTPVNADELAIAIEAPGAGQTGGTAYAGGEGPSPLRVVVPASWLPTNGGSETLELQTRVFPPFSGGVVVDQPIHITFDAYYHATPA